MRRDYAKSSAREFLLFRERALTFMHAAAAARYHYLSAHEYHGRGELHGLLSSRPHASLLQKAFIYRAFHASSRLHGLPTTASHFAISRLLDDAASAGAI